MTEVKTSPLSDYTDKIELFSTNIYETSIM